MTKDKALAANLIDLETEMMTEIQNASERELLEIFLVAQTVMVREVGKLSTVLRLYRGEYTAAEPVLTEIADNLLSTTGAMKQVLEILERRAVAEMEAQSE